MFAACPNTGFVEEEKIEPIKIPISICPHSSAGKIRGWYVLAKRLFRGDDPILFKHQFLGFNGNLIVSVQQAAIRSLFQMATKYPKLEDRDITWLGKVSLFRLKGGFKVYIPGEYLEVENPTRVETVGIFRCHTAYNRKLFYYLEIPAITAEVLLGRKALK